MAAADGPVEGAVATPVATPAAALAGGDAGTRSVPRGVVILLGAAAAVVATAGMYAAGWLLGPLMLSLMIVIAVYPIKSWLLRHGWPSWAAVLALVVVIYGTFVLLTLFLVASVSQLAALLSENSAKTHQLVTEVGTQLTKVGIDPTQAQATAGSIDLGKLVGEIGSVLSGLTSVLGSLLFVLALMLFLTAESGGTARRMGMISNQRPHMIVALTGFAHGTRNYLVVTAVFGLIVAVLDTIALEILGVPLAILWGVVSFVTNFIPNIGFLIGLVPPALLALLLGGWQLALAVVLVYCVLNLVIQSLIQPRFVGDSVGLSATVTFVALLFWAWILGPLGALLAIPVTLLLKAVLVDSDPRAQWVEALLGAEPSPPKEPRRKRSRRTAASDPERPGTDGAPVPS